MINSPSKKRVTIDDLALMIGKGFVEVKTDLTNEIHGLDQRLTLRIDGLEQKIDTLDKKVDRIDSRLTNQLDYVMLHYTKRSEHDLLTKRIKRVENKSGISPTEPLL